MIATEQHFGHGILAIAFRAGVMRAIEQTILEAILDRRVGMMQRAVLQPADGIDQYRRSQLAPRQHVIADRNFAIHLLVDQPLIDARSDEHTSVLQSLMRTSYAFFF